MNPADADAQLKRRREEESTAVNEAGMTKEYVDQFRAQIQPGFISKFKKQTGIVREKIAHVLHEGLAGKSLSVDEARVALLDQNTEVLTKRAWVNEGEKVRYLTYDLQLPNKDVITATYDRKTSALQIYPKQSTQYDRGDIVEWLAAQLQITTDKVKNSPAFLKKRWVGRAYVAVNDNSEGDEYDELGIDEDETEYSQEPIEVEAGDAFAPEADDGDGDFAEVIPRTESEGDADGGFSRKLDTDLGRIFGSVNHAKRSLLPDFTSALHAADGAPMHRGHNTTKGESGLFVNEGSEKRADSKPAEREKDLESNVMFRNATLTGAISQEHRGRLIQEYAEEHEVVTGSSGQERRLDMSGATEMLERMIRDGGDKSDAKGDVSAVEREVSSRGGKGHGARTQHIGSSQREWVPSRQGTTGVLAGKPDLHDELDELLGLVRDGTPQIGRSGTDHGPTATTQANTNRMITASSNEMVGAESGADREASLPAGTGRRITAGPAEYQLFDLDESAPEPIAESAFWAEDFNHMREYVSKKFEHLTKLAEEQSDANEKCRRLILDVAEDILDVKRGDQTIKDALHKLQTNQAKAEDRAEEIISRIDQCAKYTRECAGHAVGASQRIGIEASRDMRKEVGKQFAAAKEDDIIIGRDPRDARGRNRDRVPRSDKGHGARARRGPEGSTHRTAGR